MSRTRSLPSVRAVVATALLATTAAAVTTASPVNAATVHVSVNNHGIDGAVGVDAIRNGVDMSPGTYDDQQYWDPNGNLPPLNIPNGATSVRLEVYPNYPYDPWTSDAGGVHGERTAAQGFDFGRIELPVPGVLGAFRVVGEISSSTPVPDGRVVVDSFQIPYGYPNENFPDGTPKPQPPVSNGVAMGSFASTTSLNGQWTAGVAFPGLYTVFIEDKQTGTKVQGFMELFPGAVPAIDLDTTCFGLDTCMYLAGQPPTSATGMFHPLAPVRIADTRIGHGIAGGGVRSGDGRLSTSITLDPITRRDERLNHELKVTGVGGVPESGVAAVLVNITAADQQASPTYLTAYPRPQAIGGPLAIFDDQATFVTDPPNASNLNVMPGQNVPNMVVARVGAGGKIRLFNWWGPTNVMVDVAGYFDTGVGTGGSSFTGLDTPVRLADTRQPNSALGGRFAPGDDRSLRVAGTKGIPGNVSSVVLNVTGAGPSGIGYVTVYPSDRARPVASNLNLNPGSNRANLVVVPVGPDGRIRLAALESSTDLIVDVFGYYGGGGAPTTVISPTRVLDTRAGAPLGQGETRTIDIAGVNGVPPNATSVIANFTATQANAFSYLTVWPGSGPRPTVSTLNFAPAVDTPNLAIIPLSGGRLNIFNETGDVHVLIDVLAYTT